MASKQLITSMTRTALLPRLWGVSACLTTALICGSLVIFEASAQKAGSGVKMETNKTPGTAFSIEVPGPSSKAAADKNEDPKERERTANQFFKEKQKQSISSNPKVKEASMRLSGSLCPACLKNLALRFQKTDGVITATVEMPSQIKASQVETANAAGKLPRYAIARVTYDSNVLTIERIKDIVRTNDLAYWKVEVTDK